MRHENTEEPAVLPDTIDSNGLQLAGGRPIERAAIKRGMIEMYRKSNRGPVRFQFPARLADSLNQI